MPHITNRLLEQSLASLREATSFEVMALIPISLPDGAGEPVLPLSRFHGYPVLGSASVVDKARRGEIITAVARGIEEDALVANCFIPRHGIRAANLEDSVDLVICFECGQLHLHAFGSDQEYGQWLTISISPKPELDRVLLWAGVPLEPDEVQRVEILRVTSELDARRKEAGRALEADRIARQVFIPAIDPNKPRHAQFFQFICPACSRAEQVGLWFNFKLCSGCGKGWQLVCQPL